MLECDIKGLLWAGYVASIVGDGQGKEGGERVLSYDRTILLRQCYVINILLKIFKQGLGSDLLCLDFVDCFSVY